MSTFEWNHSTQPALSVELWNETIKLPTCVPDCIPHGHDCAAAVVPPRGDVGHVPGRAEPNHLCVDSGRQFNRTFVRE